MAIDWKQQVKLVFNSPKPEQRAEQIAEQVFASDDILRAHEIWSETS